MSGETSDSYGFSVEVPESGDYYLIIDNRDGTESQQVDVQVVASAPPVAESVDFVAFLTFDECQNVFVRDLALFPHPHQPRKEKFPPSTHQ